MNPLLHEEGIKNSIFREKYGVNVYSICADYFMDNPIHTRKLNNNYPLDFLKILLNSASKLKITNIILPCVDQSSVSKTNHINII